MDDVTLTVAATTTRRVRVAVTDDLVRRATRAGHEHGTPRERVSAYLREHPDDDALTAAVNAPTATQDGPFEVARVLDPEDAPYPGQVAFVVSTPDGVFAQSDYGVARREYDLSAYHARRDGRGACELFAHVVMPGALTWAQVAQQARERGHENAAVIASQPRGPRDGDGD